jgi:hypothetical protein
MALTYVFVNLWWTVETGTPSDVAYMMLIVGSYSLTWGGLTFSAAVGEKLADNKPGGTGRP